jgi:photosynthetic reaction center M subunit
VVDNWYLWAVDRNFAPAYPQLWAPVLDPALAR